jgi:hypothetical protein
MTDVPFADVSGDALAAYSRCGTRLSIGSIDLVVKVGTLFS